MLSVSDVEAKALEILDKVVNLWTETRVIQNNLAKVTVERGFDGYFLSHGVAPDTFQRLESLCRLQKEIFEISPGSIVISLICHSKEAIDDLWAMSEGGELRDIFLDILKVPLNKVWGLSELNLDASISRGEYEEVRQKYHILQKTPSPVYDHHPGWLQIQSERMVKEAQNVGKESIRNHLNLTAIIKHTANNKCNHIIKYCYQ